MMLREPHTIVIVPGLRGHVEDHWQTRLAATLPGAVVVPSLDRDKRDLAGRVADLQQVIEEAGSPVTIVAHSAGVLTTLHWAWQHDLPVRGALLATPPDLARPLGPEYPSLDELRESGWLPIPQVPLRFPSIVAASTNDAARRLRDGSGSSPESWGSRFIDIGPVGHLNPASGYGEWPGAEALLDVLSGMVPRRPRAAASPDLPAPPRASPAHPTPHSPACKDFPCSTSPFSSKTAPASTRTGTRSCSATTPDYKP